MIYAMSDLHGEYDKYLAMLKKIRFSDDDELYILGDVVDRGKKPLDEYSIRELAFVRFDYDREYFGGDTFIVTGHTPTLTITCESAIYHNCNNICIDCGAVFARGALACLCLDNMKEYYVY